MGPYRELGERLIDRGYGALPIMPGTKRPGFLFAGCWIGLANWQRRQLRRLEVLQRLASDPAIRLVRVWMQRRRKHRLPAGPNQINNALAADVPRLRLLDLRTVVERRFALLTALPHGHGGSTVRNVAVMAGSSVSTSTATRPW